MNIQLEETSTYEEANYVLFSGKFVDQLNLTENKLYQLHKEECKDSESDSFYVVNDIGSDSYTSLHIADRKLYK